jgi:periplasmic protein TonB
VPRPRRPTLAAPRPTKPAVRETPAAPVPDGQPTSQPTAPTTPHQSAQAPIPIAWQQSLAAWLAAHKTYPEQARRNDEQGAVVLRFTADRSGHVLNVAVVRSAGSPTLDAAAEAMVRGATLPPFPAEMTEDTITVTVQIRYALTN